MKKIFTTAVIAFVSAIAPLALAGDNTRQAAIAERGKDVMPVSLAATTHIFTKTSKGGLQRVVAKNLADIDQAQLVRRHLQELQQQFLKGDYSSPSHIHGKNMPGLRELRFARKGEIALGYQEVGGGAELSYGTHNPALVAALHKWFDAQLSDHGADATEGHHPHHRATSKR